MGVWEFIAWIVAAVIKFLVTPSLMVARGIELWEVVGITSGGAALGVLVFFRFGKWLFKTWAKITERKGVHRPVFTPGRRRIVRMRNRFGVWGLFALSGLISVPIASLLAAKYYEDDRRMPWLLMLGFASWSVLLTFISWSVKWSAFH
jgi:hypothetical protein